MTPQTRLKMFVPFFTTKPTGRGLGMALVIGAVTGHGGTIRVRTTACEGSEITVFLPLTNKPLSPIDKASDRTTTGGKVLIIFDVPAVPASTYLKKPFPIDTLQSVRQSDPPGR